MSKCPKCNSKLPFFKVGFLSNANNGITCQSCNIYIKAKSSQLSIIGGSGAVVGLFLMNWTYRMYKSNVQNWYLGIILVVVLFIGLAFLQYKTLKFYITEKPIIKNVIPDKKEVFNGVIPNKIEQPIEHLKYIYKDYSEFKLKEIANSKDYREEAIKAASQLLVEKYNT